MPGGPAGRVAHHLGALVEGARPGHPGGGQRRVVGEGGVAVVQAQEGRGALQDVRHELVADGAPLESVVVQAVAHHPAVHPFRPGERRAQSGQIRHPRQVGAGRHVEPPHGVAVGVDEARHEVRAVQVDDLRAGAAPVPYVVRRPHRGDHSVVQGDGRGGGAGRVEGADPGAGEDQIGSGHAMNSLVQEGYSVFSVPNVA